MDVVLEPASGIEQLEQEVLALFPAPGPAERVWLVEALLGVREDVAWLQGHFGGEPDLQLLLGLLELWRHRVPPEQRQLQRRTLAEDHDAAGIMVGDHKRTQPPGLQVLRGLLWLVLRQKRRLNQRSSSAIGDLAAGLRAARAPTTLAAETLGSVLPALGRATSVEEAIEALSPLAAAKHQSLSKLWTGWLLPALQALAEEGAVWRSPQPPAEPPRRPPFRRRRARVPADVEEERLETIDGPQVRRLIRSHPFDGQMPHEPPEEFGDSTFHVTVPGKGEGLPESLARFYAQRAIWTGNGHLLTNHVDVLPPDVFGWVLRSLVDLLGRTPPAGEIALGALGCLLKAHSGRTTAGLQAFRVGASGQTGPIAGGTLDGDAGLIWIPVFWKVNPEDPDRTDGSAHSALGYFRPNPSQRKLLEPVSERLALPMPKPVRDVFRSHRVTLEALAGTDVEVLDRAMAAVLADIRNELAVPVSIGGLRRSLGALVMEQCGDPAMAQLICGESLGRTMAPLSYYAPKMKTVAEIYRATLSEHFGPSPPWRIPAQATRIGSELLVTLGTAQHLASSSARHGPEGPSSLSTQATLASAHRRIADHLARMIVATTGHRPSEALFEITLADIDLDSGAVLFRDKRHDLAHDPRLACAPRIVVEQIRAYLRHVHHLRHRMPSLSSGLAAVLHGERPLLFDLNDAGEMVQPSLAQVAARSPQEWSQLPWNWSRTWIRTSAVESGAPAFLIAAQLGHFDSIGYPYSNQSPTDPLDVVARTQPWLDKLAKRQGWSVLDSDFAPDTPSAAHVDLPALRDWRPDIARVQEAARTAHRQWVLRLRVERHKLRDESLAAVLSHPSLVACGLAEDYADPARSVPADAIEALDVDDIRDDVVVACGDDAVAASARVRALKEVLRRLSKRANVPVPPLPVPIAVRRPLDNPFFQGACLALTQITALRRHVQARSQLRSPRRTFNLQVARTVEALIIFGGMNDLKAVRAVLQARSKAVSSAKIVDLLLVPVHEGRCVALRGIAALALAALASEFPDEPLPDDAEIADALLTLLPAWVVGEKSAGLKLLARLCSTAAVANRFEYSPAARFALDPDVGSIQASVEEQIAFIDADPVGPQRPMPPSGSVTPVDGSNRANAEDTGTIARQTTARRQYASLTALIPKAGKALELPLTGIKIPATSIQTELARDQVIAELRAWLSAASEPGGLWPIVRMLGEWVLAEADRRKANGRRLRNKTLATYLSRIGLALVRVLGELELTQWDERTLEDAYAYALDASNDAKHKVATALLSFHHFCEPRFDLPDADLGDVYAALKRSERRVDAAMILPVEREEALHRLGVQAWEMSADDLVGRRARLAELVGIFVARTGARISEPLGVRVADLGLRPSGDVWAILRPNRMRQLKTQAGRRSIMFEAAAPEDRKLIWSWRESVRRHAPPGRAGAAFLTAELEDPRAFGEHGVVSSLIRSELARATGRPSERLHRLRHLRAQEAITTVALSVEDARALNLSPFAEDRALQPRDFAAVSVPLGHSHWMTTIQWYLHVPWALQSRAASRLSKDYFGRQAVAGTLGYTPAFFDNLLREGATLSQEVAWFNRFRPARIAPQPREFKSVSVQSTWQWTARRVANLLTEAGRCKDLESAIRLSGAPLEAVSTLTRCAGRWERKLGRRLLPEFAAGVQRMAPGKSLRRLDGDSAIEVLWERFDQGDAQFRQDILQIVDAMFAELMPGSGETLTIPRTEAERLQQIFTAEGIPERDIRMEVDAYDMAKISVQRLADPDAEGRPALYGLRRVLSVIGIAARIQDSD